MSDYKPTDNTLKAMIRKAEEKLAVARKDFEYEYYGDAVSRAYYSVFHAISAVLAKKGLTYSSHTQTIGAFNREFVKNNVFPRHTYRKIQRLFEDRQIADYNCNLTIEKEIAEQDILDAEWLLGICKEYIKHFNDFTSSVD